MRVPCSVDPTILVGNYGDVDGVEVTCQRCGHCTESYGTDEPSILRSLALLREECPNGESNFYVDEDEEPMPSTRRPRLKRPSGPCLADNPKLDIHLVLHASEHGTFDHTQIVSEHNAKFHQHSQAIYGKKGRGQAQIKIERFREQIRLGRPTYLFLMFRDRQKVWHYYQADLLQIDTPTCPDFIYVPTYYQAEWPHIRFWYTIRELRQITEDELVNGAWMAYVSPSMEFREELLKKQGIKDPGESHQSSFVYITRKEYRP